MKSFLAATRRRWQHSAAIPQAATSPQPNKSITKFLLLCSVLAASSSAYAAESKLALVLGGGGARGGAHIGILKQLDAHGIVPDIIVGTSFGSLIGGLYAAGNSGEEVEAIIKNAELENLFQQISPRQSRSFRRKQDDSELLVKLHIRFEDGKLLLPDGLVSPHRFRLWLADQFKDFKAENQFSDLDVQFATVGTDLVNGDQLVLQQGAIDESIYASMALPGLMQPVDRGEQLIVDGGLVNNLPISAAREMGATHIIAVDVGTPFYLKDEINSSVKSIDQMARLLTRGNTERSMAAAEEDQEHVLLIRPQLDGITTAGFKDIDKSIAEGERLAQALDEEFTRFEDKPARDSQSIRKAEHTPTSKHTVRSIDFSTNSALSDDYLSAHFKTKKGDYFNRDVLEEDLQRLYGTDLFDQLRYSTESDGEQLDIKVDALEHRGRNFMQFGLTLDEDFKGVSDYSLNFSYTQTQVNAHGAEWRTNLEINKYPKISTEFYQPFGNSAQYFAVAGGSFTRAESLNDAATAKDRANLGFLRLGAGRYFSNWGSLSFDHQIGRTELGYNASLDFDFGDLDIAVTEFQFERDTLDDPAFPSAGMRFSAAHRTTTLEAGPIDIKSKDAALDLAKFYSKGRNTFALWGTYATSLDKNEEDDNPVSVGGFLNLSGLERNSLDRNKAAIIRTLFYRRLSQTGLTNVFSVPLYVGSSLEYGKLWESTDTGTTQRESITAGSVFVGANSVLGPLFIGAGYANTGDSRIYLSLGRPFVYELTSTNLDI